MEPDKILREIENNILCSNTLSAHKSLNKFLNEKKEVLSVITEFKGKKYTIGVLDNGVNFSVSFDSKFYEDKKNSMYLKGIISSNKQEDTKYIKELLLEGYPDYLRREIRKSIIALNELEAYYH